jgi:D-alanine-D-alanine ligase-like ATP-grasp enzyme
MGVVMIHNEPRAKKSSCPYCGDAPINHTFAFVESLISITLDNFAKKFIKHVPGFVKSFVDLVPEYLFRTLVFLRLAEFSRDVNKARSFRSKIIWEEAIKRGIEMEQVISRGKPIDQYRAKLKIKDKVKFFYFESIPIRPEFLDLDKNWDDKVTLKKEFEKYKIPIPAYFELSIFSSLFGSKKIEKIFSKLQKPIIVKPRVGSRGRHTVTNIQTLEQFKAGIKIVKEICPYMIVEEHLHGGVCRATLVGGELGGFYKAQSPVLIGDGRKTIQELIDDIDKNRHSRVEQIRIDKELHDHLARSGFKISDVLREGVNLSLTHRMGRLFGGTTVEMLDNLHPSLILIFKEAARVTGLSVVGFDAIIPDPTKSADSQKWGIIECNTLPFIDLHYFTLEGKPKNIAGMIWDAFLK